MTGNELRLARIALGRLWGWDRPVFATELGDALGCPAGDKGERIRDHERARDKPVPWALAAAVSMLLDRALPPSGIPPRPPPRYRSRSKAIRGSAA